MERCSFFCFWKRGAAFRQMRSALWQTRSALRRKSSVLREIARCPSGKVVSARRQGRSVGVKCANAWRNRHRCRAPRSPPCARRSRRGAEGWEWAHRVSRGCGGNARKRSAGVDPPDRRRAFRRSGSRRRRGRTSLVPCRPRHGAPNGARRRWRGRETLCCAPLCPIALRSRRAKGRNLRRATRAIPATVRRWDECRGATVFLLRGWTWASGVRNCEKAPSGEHAVGGAGARSGKNGSTP